MISTFTIAYQMGWSTTGTSCLARRGPKLLSILLVPCDHASKNVSYVRNYSFTYIEFKVLHFIEYEYTIAYVYCLCQRGVSARYQDSFRLPSDLILSNWYKNPRVADGTWHPWIFNFHMHFTPKVHDTIHFWWYFEGFRPLK